MSPSRAEETLHAYHDGELRGLARWRFERRLARSPALRRELEALALMRELVREDEAAAPAPDLWEGIARRLPAEPAQDRGWAPAGGWWLRPLGAVAVAAAAALVFVLVSGDNAAPGVVRWIDSGERNVVVLEGDEDVTIIWVLGADAAASPGEGGSGEEA
jgi:anti-sigma factor RsiW